MLLIRYVIGDDHPSLFSFWDVNARASLDPRLFVEGCVYGWVGPVIGMSSAAQFSSVV